MVAGNQQKHQRGDSPLFLKGTRFEGTKNEQVKSVQEVLNRIAKKLWDSKQA